MIHQVIELSGLVLGYKGMPDLTSHIHKSFNGPGIYAFVGRNGSGKSTLLRTILGLQSSVAGEVFIGEMNDGVSVKSLSFEKRAQVLQLANDMSSVGSGRDIELWGLEDLMNRRLDTLSDGQALRVMFARASAQGASWILLDEPTAFLDIPSRKKLVQMLKEFSKTRGIIIATHDLHSLAEMRPVGVSEVCGFGLKDLEIKADTNEELVDKWEEALGALLA